MNLFVYGSLKSGKHAHYILEKAQFLGEGVIRGKLIRPHPRWPGVVEGPGEVHGELYDISRIGLDRLDAYEGYPELFTRKQVEVWDDHSQPMGEAWVYLFNQAQGNEEVIESGVW